MDKLDKNDKAEEMDELESHFGKIFNCKGNSLNN